MICVQVEILPQSSLAFHVRVMVRGQPQPLTLSVYQTWTQVSQLSDALARPVLHGSVLWPQVSVLSGGQQMVGGIVSLIVMYWVQYAELPQASVAFHLRVIIFGQVPQTESH